jgi:N-methylhydantoinase A
VLQRADVAVGVSIPGPVVVEQPDTTTVVPPGWSVTADGAGNLVITRTAG